MTKRVLPGFGDGLVNRLRKFTRPRRPGTQIVAALLVGWAPLEVLGATGQLLTGRREPLVFDLSVHVRLLIAVPLFVVAKMALKHQSEETLSRLIAEGFVADPERPRLEQLIGRTERLLNSYVPEILLLALSLFVGLATLVGWVSPTGVIQGVSTTQITAARAWFGVVSLPLFFFLFGRSLWWWAMWVWMLGSLACFRLRLEPGHPDRRGGISFLTLPSLAFHAPFLLAASSVLCASWGTQIEAGGARLQQFKNVFIAFVVLGELLAFGPLLLFTPRLFLSGRAGLREYGNLATDYLRQFRHRWMAPGARNELLGTADIQALTDLGNEFRESVEKAKTLVFGPRDLVVLLVLMLLPTLLLLLAEMPVEAVLRKLGKLLLGAH